MVSGSYCLFNRVMAVFDVLVPFWIKIVWILDLKPMWDHFMVVYYLQTL